MILRFLHIRVNGEISVVEVSRENEGDELRRLVDGWIESYPAPLGHVLFLNEEGALRGLPFNMLASLLVKTRIVGDTVLVGPINEDGDTTSVTPAMMYELVEGSHG